MCARLTEEHLCGRMCELHYWACAAATVGGVCVRALFNEQTTSAFIMTEQEGNERNEEEQKRSAARARLGFCCVC